VSQEAERSFARDNAAHAQFLKMHTHDLSFSSKPHTACSSAEKCAGCERTAIGQPWPYKLRSGRCVTNKRDLSGVSKTALGEQGGLSRYYAHCELISRLGGSASSTVLLPLFLSITADFML